MKLVINIPAFNEEAVIANTIKSIPRSFDGIHEVMIQVVNDGSKDATVKVSLEAGVEAVYSHEVNRGIGVAFRTAAEKALENGADIMVNIDADGQFNPADIPKLIAPILRGEADLVSADRFTHDTAVNIPWIKNILNRFAAWIIGSFMNIRISDLTCGFRAYSREVLLRLNLPGDFTYTQEVIIDALGKNFKIRWIPVEVKYFSERKSRVVRSLYRYINNSFKIILKAIRDVRPMKFFGIPGLLLMISGLIIFAVFVYFYFQELKVSPYRNYLLLSVTFFLIGLQFVVFALIADMIKSSRKLTEDLMYLARKEKYGKSLSTHPISLPAVQKSPTIYNQSNDN